MKILTQSKKKLSVSIKIIKDTFQGFMDDNVMRLSASLAYATLFSIIPLLSLLVTIGVLLNVDSPISYMPNWNPSSALK